jgi:hypothetical protein
LAIPFRGTKGLQEGKNEFFIEVITTVKDAEHKTMPMRMVLTF